jgi:dCTP deaminase
MLLTGTEIRKAMEEGRIIVDPLTPEHVGPNSVDLTLADVLILYELALDDGIIRQQATPDGKQLVLPIFLDTANAQHPSLSLKIPESGLLLRPGKFYLAACRERVQADEYVAEIQSRSSVTRLGLIVHGGVGEMGATGTWTFGLQPLVPVYVRPGLRICKMVFHKAEAGGTLYRGKYLNETGVGASKIGLDVKKRPPLEVVSPAPESGSSEPAKRKEAEKNS